MQEQVIHWLPRIIVLAVVWSLLIGLYTDLSQPVNTARIFSTTENSGRTLGEAFVRDAARFHEMALLSAAVYEDNEYARFDVVRAFPDLSGLWELTLQPHTALMLKKAESESISSLHYEVYKRRDISADGKVVYAVVFRGTDRFKDFVSNFRWFLKPLPIGDDQYDFVRKNIEAITQEIVETEQIDDSALEIVAAGHSLGGGLAQHAAYASDSIRTVYTYMSTSVTGYFDLNREDRRRRKQGLRIFRIHETGEILAALRRLMKHIFPVSQIHPTVVEVRYNFQNYRFNPFKLHSIALLAKHLTEVWHAENTAV